MVKVARTRAFGSLAGAGTVVACGTMQTSGPAFVVEHSPLNDLARAKGARFGSAMSADQVGDAEAMLSDRITRMAARAHPHIHEWDVINEAVDDKTGELRETSFSRALGGVLNVIEFCLRTTAEVSPGTRPADNEYMSRESGNENHRAGALRRLEAVLNRGAPITVFGMQSHSNFDMPNEFTPDKQKARRQFCDDAAGLGLQVSLTEFDVNDTRLGPDAALRDGLIASFTKDYPT